MWVNTSTFSAKSTQKRTTQIEKTKKEKKNNEKSVWARYVLAEVHPYVKQIDTVFVDTFIQYIVSWFGYPSWKGWFVIRQCIDTRPGRCCWCTQHTKNTKQFVDFGIARKQRRTVDHFSKYTAQRPNINGHLIMDCTCKQTKNKSLVHNVPALLPRFNLSSNGRT